jgi:hypothetical protein
VSRRLAKVRDLLRVRLREVVTTYSFTKEELEEAERNGLTLNPNTAIGSDGPAGPADRSADLAFDEAIAEIYHRQMQPRADDRNLSSDR